MKKILVVSFTSGEKYTGGLQCSKRNYESLQTIVGEINVVKYTIEPYKGIEKVKTKLKRLRDIFYGAMGGLDKNKTKEIIDIISRESITDLFIDSSLLGLLAKRIRKIFPNIRIYTFFHNFECGFVKDHIRINKDYVRFYWIILAKLNEIAAVKYSDKIISLNERDANRIKEIYGKYPDNLIPITLKAPINKDFIKDVVNTNKEALFIGSYFFGNVQGIIWFCKEVLPYVDIHLTIVGASMDKILNEIPQSDKVTVFSNVPDLTPFYDNADFVVLPILSGSGMKVKTAESLMHGKFIIGTDEAFRGYKITELQGVNCNTAEEFIRTIKGLNLSLKYNAPSRELFDREYSFESSLTKFSQVLD